MVHQNCTVEINAWFNLGFLFWFVTTLPRSSHLGFPGPADTKQQNPKEKARETKEREENTEIIIKNRSIYTGGGSGDWVEKRDV